MDYAVGSLHVCLLHEDAVHRNTLPVHNLHLFVQQCRVARQGAGQILRRKAITDDVVKQNSAQRVHVYAVDSVGIGKASGLKSGIRGGKHRQVTRSQRTG